MSSARSSDVRVHLTYQERDSGPLADTHHWHCEVWIDEEQVENLWCFTRDIAAEEALGALAVAGVGGLD